MSNSTNPPTDQQTRNHAGTLAVAIALLVGWAVVAVHGQLRYIDQLAQTSVPSAAEQMVWLTRIVALGFSLGVLVTGAWILWIGYRTCRAGQFPPLGVRVFRTTRVYTGRKARIIGWVTQLLGLLVLLLGTTATWLFVELAQVLLRS